MKLVLEIISGEKKGVKKEFTKNIITIGREQSPGECVNDLNFDHRRDRCASRDHCEIRRAGASYIVSRINKKNKMFVNGKEVVSSELKDGDIVQCGINGPEFRVNFLVDYFAADEPVKKENPLKPEQPVRKENPAQQVRAVKQEKTGGNGQSLEEPVRDAIVKDSGVKKASFIKNIGRTSVIRIVDLAKGEIDYVQKQFMRKYRRRLTILICVIALLAAGLIAEGIKRYRVDSELREADVMLRRCVQDSEDTLRREIALIRERTGENEQEIKKLVGKMRSLQQAIQSLGANESVSAARKAVVRIVNVYDIVQSGTGRTATKSGAPYRYQLQGSGFCVRENGYIVTNAHVVCPWEYNKDLSDKGLSGRRKSLTVTFDGANEGYAATIQGIDHSLDLALIKIDKSDCPRIDFCEGNPPVASTVLILGFPVDVAGFNSTPRCVALGGIISAVNDDGSILYDVITHTGNSGGPVLSSSGKVVGVHRAGVYYDGQRQLMCQGAEEMLSISSGNTDTSITNPEGTVEIADIGLSKGDDAKKSALSINSGISMSNVRGFVGRYIP